VRSTSSSGRASSASMLTSASPWRSARRVMGEARSGQAENDEPQPQVPFTFGLLNLNPEP
jgi:hypothetical protein